MMSLIFWSRLLLLLNTVVISFSARWCPPSHFPVIRQMRKSNIRSAMIAHIFGTLSGPSPEGYEPESWPSDDQISRQLYYHLGILGMDHIHFTVLYNTTAPPTVEDIYPNASSCVRQWHNLGVFSWETLQYAGYTDEVHSGAYNEAYGRIRAEYDWIAILDIDELLVPSVWNPTNKRWCSHERPTIIEIALQQILSTATVKYLDSFAVMEKFKHAHVPAADACPLGSAVQFLGDNQHACTPINYITLPGYYYQTSDVNVIPTQRCQFAGAYGINNDSVVTKEEDHQGQTWKSIHNTAVTTELTGTLTMHLGVGFSILAPRLYHKSGVSLEVAHLRHIRKDGYLIGDNKLVKLFKSYSSCMIALGTSQEPLEVQQVQSEVRDQNQKKLCNLKKQLQHLRKKMDELA